MIINKEKINYTEIPGPVIHRDILPVDLTDATMQERKEKILAGMKRSDLDVLLVYADREHGSNFAYLTGFSPRFEEALLVLHADGTAYLMLGNEMHRMAGFGRIKAEPIHTPHFSLPDQPMESRKNLRELLQDAGICQGKQIGIAGWKLRYDFAETDAIFDVPYFIVKAVTELAGISNVKNAADIFISPVCGARITMNANEIAFYEYGASLASIGMADLLSELAVGKTELELASALEHYGQPNSVQTICATGERFTNAVVAPRNKQTALGDRFSATVGYRGGLTNRSGYLAETREDLPEAEQTYLEQVAFPYFSAMASWYSTVGIGCKASEIYGLMEDIVPKAEYGWTLNPGHYTADEEWVSSPFTRNSEVILQSGMLLQMDLILKVPGFGGCNGEDGIAIMDEELQRELAESYPEVWKRFRERQDFVREEIGIPLKEEVFPMSDLCGYLRPYLLDKKRALRVNK